MKSQNRQVLPQSKQQKQALKEQIQLHIQKLNANIEEQKKMLSPNSPLNKQILSIIEKVQILNQRLNLIDKCEQFSLHRLNHLQQIFKYYCTHIFKIGKHMTFDRLQYEKQHLNSQRFFLFLKDFGLTTTEIEGKPKQIVLKQNIMTIFKKTSSNSRDLNFQEFIKCIERIGTLYYDQKSNYWNKIQQQKLERIKRKKQIQKRKLKRMKLNGQKDQKLEQQIQKLQNQEKQINITNKNQQDDQNEQNQDNQQEEQNKNQELANQGFNKQGGQSSIVEQNNQNDDLIKQMMQNKDLEDPNEQINQITKQKRMQSDDLQKRKKNQKNYQQKLLTLTNNQKIEYFYQMIGVDSVKDFKNKLTILNMISFKGKKQNETNMQASRQNKTISMDESVKNNQMDKSKSVQDQQRLIKLKEKMNQKKEKQKNQPIPKPKQVKQSQTARKRRQMKEQRQIRMAEKIKEQKQENDAIKQKAKDQKKPLGSVGSGSVKNTKDTQNSNPATGSVRVSFNQKQVNWNMLQKLTFEQMKFRQFNPTRLYHQEDDDYIFMQEYGNFKLPNRSSRMQARQRQSLSIVQNVRKRADQVQKSQKKQENKLNNKLGLGMKGSIKGKF